MSTPGMRAANDALAFGERGAEPETEKAGLTDDEIKLLTRSRTAQEWNDACNAIKRAHNGYPADWYPRVVMSGLMSKVSKQFTAK